MALDELRLERFRPGFTSPGEQGHDGGAHVPGAAGGSVGIERGGAVASATEHQPDQRIPDQRTADWFRAVRMGFHENPYPAEELREIVDSYLLDGRELTGVYDDAAPAPALPAGIPVGTFASYRKTVNVGAGRLLDAHLITVVTVRPSHRRRGILRRMMTEDLRRAQADGVAVAALTASEATIYGRFGFGAATWLRETSVDVRGGLPLAAAPEGRTVGVEPASLRVLAPEVFARFHRGSRGSVDRQDGYWRRAAGQWGRHGATPDPSVRAAVHLDADGTAQGYVAYSFAGWETKPPTLQVHDLVAATGTAHRELWRYLGAHDLVEKVTYGAAAVDDPLPWAATDPRRVTVTATEDLLWLRLLDVPAALQAREYDADGELRIRVTDDLGLAGGTFALTVRGGTASVETLAGQDGAGSAAGAAASAGPAGNRPGGAVFPEAGSEPGIDIDLDMATLGSLYLGGVGVQRLAGAGRIRAARQDAVERAARLLDLRRPPYGITGF